jgi:hypothetical protein
MAQPQPSADHRGDEQHPPPGGEPAIHSTEHLEAAASHGHPEMTHHQHGAHDGHGGNAGHSEAMFARPFWVSLALTIPAGWRSTRSSPHS